MKPGELFLIYFAIVVLSYIILVTLRTWQIPPALCLFIATLLGLFVIFLNSDVETLQEIEHRGYNSLVFIAFFLPIVLGLYMLTRIDTRKK